MPNRLIRESITTSHSWDELSLGAESFCTRLITVVDDFGRQDSRPSVLRAKCYPLKLAKVTDKMVATWLGELIDAGMVIVYVAEGGQFLQFRNWEKYQNRRATTSKFPAPQADDLTCRKMIADDRSFQQLPADAPVTRNSDLDTRNSVLDTREASTSAGECEQPVVDFQKDFWEPFPGEKGSKPDAERAWKKLTLEEQRLAVRAIPNYVNGRRVQTGYIKHVSGWLNGRYWEQYQKPEIPPPRSGNGTKMSVDEAFAELERRYSGEQQNVIEGEVMAG